MEKSSWSFVLMDASISVSNIFGFDVHYVIMFEAQLTFWWNFAELVDPTYLLGRKLGKS